MQNNLLPVKAQVQQDRQHISDKRAMGDKRLQVGELFVKAPDYERLSLLILDYYVVADLARADKLGYFDRQNKAVPDSLRLPHYERKHLKNIFIPPFSNSRTSTLNLRYFLSCVHVCLYVNLILFIKLRHKLKMLNFLQYPCSLYNKCGYLPL